MDDVTDQLPSDIDALQALVTAARAERDAAIAMCDAAITARDHALSQMDRLRHLLRQLQRAQFGRRSEKLDPEQLQLAIEDIEQAVAANEAAEDKKVADSEEFKKRLAFTRNRLLMDSLLASEGKAATTPDAMKKVYEEASKQIGGEQEVHARHILVET
ncbi:MAG: transposase, partial [Staphylococcus warneri]|nr:transposase [Staphylococcus warneri]